MNVVAIVSGGMDSVTLAHSLADAGHELHLLSFDYGQRHRRELECAAICAHHLRAPHDVIALPLSGLIASSALTGDVDVPEGHYAAETMRQTVVPNRNMVMLAIAGAVAVSEGAEALAIGVHGGDHFIYPDCRPEFVSAFETALLVATIGHRPDDFRVLAPFLYGDKADVVRIGDSLGVPWEDTWSCYVGGDVHCGACGTCFERREAFAVAGVTDPTTYAAEPEYADPRP